MAEVMAKAAKKKTISQSQTQWVKKGDKLSDGTVAKKGYVARKGDDTKKVTANIRLSASGDSAISKRLAGKKVGDVVKAQPSKKKPTTKGGGVTPAQAKAKAKKPSAKSKSLPEGAVNAGPYKPKPKTASQKAAAIKADKSKATKSSPKGSSPAKENAPKAGTKYSKSVGTKTPWGGKQKATANTGPKSGDTRNSMQYGQQIFKGGKWVKK